MKTKLLIQISFIFAMQLGLAQEKEQAPTTFPFGEPGAASRGFFGEDDRREVQDAEGFEDYVRATAVMVPKSSISGNRIYGVSLREQLSQRFGLNAFAEDVRFLDQPTAASCTGFLIAPDILVTAGHCIETLEDAKQYVWVFDYTNEMNFNGKYLEVDQEDVFEVVEVLSAELNDETESDYSVLRLARKSDRRPYRFRTGGLIPTGVNIFTVGSPTGIPLKLAENAVVVENTSENWFKSDIDVFPGNSGGPVFDRAGWIEGILVRGAVKLSQGDYSADFVHDTLCNCIRTVQFDEVAGTAGSQTHKITEIPVELMYESIYDNLEYGIRNFSKQRFEDWDDYSWIFTYDYTRRRGALEEIAMEVRNYNALNAILPNTAAKYSDSESREYLGDALGNDDFYMLQILLENGLYADAGIDHPHSLLQEAVLKADKAAAALLVEHGANFRVADSRQNNLLHLAASQGNLELIEYLVSLGVDAGVRNSDKKLAEKIAKANDHKAAYKYLKAARKGKV